MHTARIDAGRSSWFVTARTPYLLLDGDFTIRAVNDASLRATGGWNATPIHPTPDCCGEPDRFPCCARSFTALAGATRARWSSSTTTCPAATAGSGNPAHQTGSISDLE